MTQTAPLRLAHASGLNAVARELSELHRTMLRSGDEGRMVWLSVFTLIVACSDEADAERAAEVVGGIAAQHPARALIIIARPDEPSGIDAELSLQCSVAGGSGQVCAEVVRLNIGGDAALHLGSVVRPLLLPDVPVHLWLAGAPNMRQALTPEALAMVERIVVDSDAYPDPDATLGALAAAPRRGDGALPVADLAWLRITPWRELIARAFDSPVRRRFLAGVETIEIQPAISGGAGARLLGGWLRSRLEASGRPAPMPQFDDGAEGEEGMPLIGIAIDAAAGASRLRLALRAVHGAIQTSVEIDGEQVAARTVPTDPPSLNDLVGAALQESGHDPVYLDALRISFVTS